MVFEEKLRELSQKGILKKVAAQQLGVSVYKLEQMRLALGLSWARSGSYVVDGVLDTLEGHAKRLGVPATTVRYRIQKNQDVKAPSSIRPVTREEVERFIELRKDGKPAMQAAEQVGRPFNTLKNAAKRMFPDYEQLVLRVSRNRHKVKTDKAA